MTDNDERPDQDRRRLIDELIATGVPAVTAAEAGSRRGRWLVGLYVVIPLVAIWVLVGLRESPPPPAASGKVPVADSEDGSRRNLDVSAQNISFDTDKLTLEAGAKITIHFENRDAPTILHNVAVYRDATAAESIFQGEIIPGGTDIDYEFRAPTSGEYFFRCDVHPGMNGTVVVDS